MVKWFPTRRALTKFCHANISSTHDPHDKHDVTQPVSRSSPLLQDSSLSARLLFLIILQGCTLFVWILDIGHIFHSRQQQGLNVETIVIGDFCHIATRRAFRHYRRWQCNRAKVPKRVSSTDCTNKRWLYHSTKMEIRLSFDAAAIDCCCCCSSSKMTCTKCHQVVHDNAI